MNTGHGMTTMASTNEKLDPPGVRLLVGNEFYVLVKQLVVQP